MKAFVGRLTRTVVAWRVLLLAILLLPVAIRDSGPAALGCLLIGAVCRLRRPLRGLDPGRLLWGFGAVAVGVSGLRWGWDGDWRIFWLVGVVAAVDYLVTAQCRCRVYRRRYAVLSVAAGVMLLSLGLPAAVGAGVTAAVAAGVALYVVIWCPLLLLRAALLILNRTLYRIRTVGMTDGIPDRGAVLLVANHVSFLDFAFILAVTSRPVHFMVLSRWYRLPVLHWYLRRMGFLEVPPGNHPKATGRFLADIRHRLSQGAIIAVYPEGSISDNGFTGGFKRGVEQMLPVGKTVTVVPLRLGLYWGRLFAWAENRLRYIPPLRWPIPVSVTIGAPLHSGLGRYALWLRICEMGAETEMLRQEWERPVHRAFVEMVQQKRHQTVFCDVGGESIPNWQMLVRALVLSRAIRRLAAPDEANIGIFLPGSTAASAATLGVLFADRTPALLNFTAGPEALAAAIKQADLRCILTSRLFLSKLKMAALPGMVMLEDVARGIGRGEKIRATLAVWLRSSRALTRHYAPESWDAVERTGAILFTSGSSGVPKGVVLSHHNLNSDIFSFWRVISWSRERDTLLGQLPLFHAFGLTVGLWFPAISGTRVCYYPNPLDAARICEAIREERISLLVATPTFLQSYCRKARPGDFDSLRLVVTGAEKLRSDVVEQLEQISPLTVTEGYGCTELSPIAAINLAQSCFALGRQVGKLGSIGQPLPGMAARTVHPDTGAVLDADQVGLLEFKGPNVMQGYLNEPELTARVMHDGWYSTGDLARIDADGYIFIAGRQSRFSKIGGEMVPHELLESRLADLYAGEARHFAVTGCKDAKRGERLLVFHNLADLDVGALIARMRACGMPNLWIPKQDDFIRIDTIPVLASGKLDLQALQRLADARTGD